MTFKELGLHDDVINAISYMGFENATPIQEQAIPKIIEGKDLIACAQTGTGKTAGMVIPNLLLCDHSMIVHDPKGELYDLTGKVRANKLNHNVLLFHLGLQMFFLKSIYN